MRGPKKLYPDAVGIRLPAGTRDRIKAERGDMSEPEWLRSVVLAALDAARLFDGFTDADIEDIRADIERRKA